MKRATYFSASIVSAAFVAIMAIIVWNAADHWRGGGFDPAGAEMARLRQVLKLKAGVSVADVGAGGGDLTLALAAEVGPAGRVFSSDIDPSALEQIRGRVNTAGFRNVTLIKAGARTTGLPENCCDAIVLRRVYHHLSDPAATTVDARRSLRPGAVLAVIDFPPTLAWLWPWPPPGVPKNRKGHGARVDFVVDEVTASGFELVELFDDWPGRGPLGSYCAVFRTAALPGDARED